MKKEIYLNASIEHGLANDIQEVKAKQKRLLNALLSGSILWKD